jgi:hypothetical protein
MRLARVEQEASKAKMRYRARTARLYLGATEDAMLDEQAHTARALWNLLHEWYTCRDGGIAKRPSLAEIDRYYGGGQRVWPLKRLSCANMKMASPHLIAPVITPRRPHQSPARLGMARPTARPGHPAGVEDLPERLGSLL